MFALICLYFYDESKYASIFPPLVFGFPPTLYSPARTGFGCFPILYFWVLNAIFILTLVKEPTRHIHPLLIYPVLIGFVGHLNVKCF